MLKQKLHIITNSTKTKFLLLFATIGVCVVTSVLSIGENVNVDTDVMNVANDKVIKSIGRLKDFKLNDLNELTNECCIYEIDHKYNKFDVMVDNAHKQLEKIGKEKQEEIQKQKQLQLQHKNNQSQTQTRLSRGNGNPYQGRIFNITASHYSGREEENGKGRAYRNALGKALTYQTIAVPRNIPLGSLIKLIDNEGNIYIKIALDYGSTKHIRWIDSNTMKIDVCKPYASRKKIDNLGIKHYRGEIIRWGF
ncbi:hypothetical protein FDC62_12920 [Clostridium botulinum]|uniref:hypothetical protein n=1 Tax=Clostridium botulinum TaxID=1491 RepID=UPI0009933146|nr:hypothetical protein [Clostridium botulinum]NFO99071.1 hypothetical protein [Clostridium botulinum]OOV52393.1 hypothetical protein B1A66_04250 [Clostridium botulinum D/C]OOV55737.1 hypothetical protein B1A67_07785 [Clostridium botulinum D/C]OOV57184.1 hypothetical protein B0673_04865 [Clostridium botulinum D/C]OOV61230.1 hypothetical protein B1A69_10635 [Clostridium botulinum D/C]